jgi:predicted ATPase/DNA-binding CsgD family transcriptional regulator
MSHPVAGMASGLPVGLTSFVGRRREVAQARRLLSTSRLVSLTGPGGVGKTRLALEVTNAVRRLFPDGVVFVELEQVGDPALVANTVAISAGLREAGRQPLEMLIDYLAPRRLLLVLDNSEHVLTAISELATALLQGCPELRILATTREWLGIEGEVVMAVQPLTVPDPDQPLGEQDLLTYEAVALFSERATLVVPGFSLTERNWVDVAEICRRLDGLPLAIELAAARLRALSEKEMLARLTDHPHLLAAPQRRDAPARQQTLRSCIEWSYGLCSAAEQLLWARLSVFAGSFELDAAEDVCSGDGLAVAEVFECVTSLIDKSILVSERHADVVRFRMLETIREFGRERLQETGDEDRLRRAHREWYLQLVERADADWVSPRQVEWFGRLDREHANVQAAVDYSLTRPGEVEAAMRILTAVFHFYWWGRGWAREGRIWLARALDQTGSPSAVRARALLTDAALALGSGDFDGGAERLAEARAIAESVADPVITAHACWVAGSAAQYVGDLATSMAEAERGLAVLEPGRDEPLRLDLLLSYAIAAGIAGDGQRATECHMETLRITEPPNEYFHRSYALWALGLFAMGQGEHRRSADLHRESVRLRRGVRDVTGIAWSLESLAWPECALGHHERAVTMLGAADRYWEIMGRPLETYGHLYPFHESCEQTSREQLGTAGFEAAFAKGRAFSVDDGIAYALGEHAAPTPPPRSEPAPVLTTREREIAELIAEGLSNRDIGARLTISVRTAETHAQNILLKLGFRSRAQIAAWVAKQRKTAAARDRDRQR